MGYLLRTATQGSKYLAAREHCLGIKQGDRIMYALLRLSSGAHTSKRMSIHSAPQLPT